MSQFNVTKRIRLEGLLGACAWQRLEATARASQGMTRETMRPVDPTMVRFERCNPTRVGGGSSHGLSLPWTWEFHRIGPFNSSGGNDWTNVRIPALPTARSSAPARVAVRQYLLASATIGGQILGYPPLHQHHFHTEEHSGSYFAGALISHGDDQCLASQGGVACLIRQLPDGYVQWLRTPLNVDADVNDVRSISSAVLMHWLLVAVEGIAVDDRGAVGGRGSEAGTGSDGNAGELLRWLRPLTQMRIFVTPVRAAMAYPGVYLVPAARTCAFYREGRFAVSAPLVWSYLHTHPIWVEEMSLFANASADSMALTSKASPLQPSLREGLDAAQTSAVRAWLRVREAASGAWRACHFLRSPALREEFAQTAEVGGHFYRKALGCVPFEVVRGMHFLVVVITSPDSDAAADRGMAPIHTFFRLFATVPGTDMPTCTGQPCYEWVMA